jgi:hypothetical protein
MKALLWLRDLIFRRSDVYFGDSLYSQKWQLSLFLIAFQVLRFCRYDPFKQPHDHPRAFLWIVLRGGFVEHRPGYPDTWHGKGARLWRRCSDAHYLELSADAWVLSFALWPRLRSWGFLTPTGRKPWREVVAARQAQLPAPTPQPHRAKTST